MLVMLLSVYLMLSLGAGFLMWAMCRMASLERPMLELRVEAEGADADGLVVPTAVAY